MIPPARASAVRSAAGRPARRTNGSALAVMSGTQSTREGCARLVSSVGLKLSACLAVAGRRTLIGMHIREKEEAVR